MIKCFWCKADAPDPRAWLHVWGREVPLCQECFLMGRQLFNNLGQIRSVSGEKGIHVGVPKKETANE